MRGSGQRLAGWGFGGVGAGIALAGAVVLAIRDTGTWRTAWLASAAVALALAAVAWPLRPASGPAPDAGARPGGPPRWLGILLVSYTLEGVGYIIAGTFLVAAVSQGSPGWAGSAAWILVGLAALPGPVLWGWLSRCWSRPGLLLAALLIQDAAAGGARARPGGHRYRSSRRLAGEVTPVRYPVAVIRGDGIGPELVGAALAVLEAAGAEFGFTLDTTEVAAGAAAYQRDGAAISAAGLAAVRQARATLKGPVGLPEVRLPDGTEAGVLGGILRGGLDLYASVRPVRLLPGVPSRLRAEPGSIDYVIVRENTEGLYLSRGKATGNRHAMSDTLLVTRAGCERISRFAFRLARQRDGAPADGTRRVTLADKANVLGSMYFFRQVFLEVAAEFPDVTAECRYVDAVAQDLVMCPERFDVIVTENMLGDILSDLGGGTVGGVAMCPCGNLGDGAAYFEPIHGSAPALAGRDLANPIGQVLAAAMLADYLGEPAAAGRIRDCVSAGLAGGDIVILPDGTAAGGPAAVAGAITALIPPGQP